MRSKRIVLMLISVVALTGLIIYLHRCSQPSMTVHLDRNNSVPENYGSGQVSTGGSEPKREDSPLRTASPPRTVSQTANSNRDTVLVVPPAALPTLDKPPDAPTPSPGVLPETQPTPATTAEAPPLKNIALGKPVTTSARNRYSRPLWVITDGSLEEYVDLARGTQWVQIDLQEEYPLALVRLWHHYVSGEQRFYSIIVQAANDPAFQTSVVTLFNNDFDNSAGLGAGFDAAYVKTNQFQCLPVAGNGVKARYVRCYGRGSSVNHWNEYAEIEVFTWVADEVRN